MSELAQFQQQISQKITHHFVAQQHFVDVLRSDIIFCDICCFSSARSVMQS